MTATIISHGEFNIYFARPSDRKKNINSRSFAYLVQRFRQDPTKCVLCRKQFVEDDADRVTFFVTWNEGDPKTFSGALCADCADGVPDEGLVNLILQDLERIATS